MQPYAMQGRYAELVRLTVTSVLSVGIVGAAIFEQIAHPNINSPLIGWAGTVVGVFIGHQVAQQSANRATVAAIQAQKSNGDI